MEYVFVAQHRENWANVGALKDSLADVSYFSLELTKRMDMRYMAPPLPINLNLMSNNATNSVTQMQKQLMSEVERQTDRLNSRQASAAVTTESSLSQPLLHDPVGRDTGGGTPQEYDFSDIEAMFNKNK